MHALHLAQDFYIKNQNGATSNQNRRDPLPPYNKFHGKENHGYLKRPQTAEYILRIIDTLQIIILKRLGIESFCNTLR